VRDAEDFDTGAVMTANTVQSSSRGFGISMRDMSPETGIVAIEGDLDLSAAPRLKWALVDLLESGHTRLVVDLSMASFMDSTALGVLLSVKRRIPNEAGLAVVCTAPNVLKIFELAGVDGAFAIYPTLEQALARLQRSAT
jgi:anti-sigma B factor antagonist